MQDPVGEAARRDAGIRPASGSYWDDFQTGVARAEGDLEKLAADLLLLPSIVNRPSQHGLDTAGKLAGYLARVAEALRRKDEPRAESGVAKVLHASDWFAGLTPTDAKIGDCCPGADGLRPTVVIRFPDDAAGRRAAARVFELLAGVEEEKRDHES